MVLGDIFSPSHSVAVWQRPENKVVQSYFNSVTDALGIGIRNVFPISSLQAGLIELLPEAIGKAQAIDDIYLVADMLTCLFDCEEVGLRLTSMTQPMCPRFHFDNIPVRLVTTYLGPGSQWLPNELADTSHLGHAAKGKKDSESGLYQGDDSIKQLASFDVALLKGSAWAEDHPAAIHRSCPLEQGQSRVLLTLDPA